MHGFVLVVVLGLVPLVAPIQPSKESHHSQRRKLLLASVPPLLWLLWFANLDHATVLNFVLRCCASLWFCWVDFEKH
jgi:Ca2+/Na+ antiporter